MLVLSYNFINIPIVDGYINPIPHKKSNYIPLSYEEKLRRKLFKYDGVLDLWAAGKTINEIIEIKRLSYTTIRNFLIENDVYEKRKKEKVASERDIDFINLYTKELKTLDEIGKIYGLTRERVRQRLKKFGYDRKDGGILIRTAINKAQDAMENRGKTNKREIQCINYYGCSIEVRDAYGNCNKLGTIPMAYKTQKNNALKHGIQFNLTLPEWIDIWEKSGHFQERGRGKYVMGRMCDMGAYEVGNVYIIHQSENSKESRQMDKIRGRWKLYEVDGIKYTAGELSEKYKIGRATLSARLKSGWTLNDALTIKPSKHNKNVRNNNG